MLGQHGGVVAHQHRQRGLGLAERDIHREVVDLGRFLDQAEIVGEVIGNSIVRPDFVDRIDHVIGVERLAIVPEHVVAQRECIGQPVLGHFPAFGEIADRLERFEIIADQPAIHDLVDQDVVETTGNRPDLRVIIDGQAEGAARRLSLCGHGARQYHGQRRKTCGESKHRSCPLFDICFVLFFVRPGGGGRPAVVALCALSPGRPRLPA